MGSLGFLKESLLHSYSPASTDTKRACGVGRGGGRVGIRLKEETGNNNIAHVVRFYSMRLVSVWIPHVSIYYI